MLGAHEWYTAPLGTAGNAISFTQAMTLDASGNLGVGETSLTERITARKDGTGVYATIQVKNTNSTATLNVGVGGSAVANSALQNNAYLINAGSSALVLGTSDTERARITSAGEFLVGVTAVSDTPNNGVVLRNYSSGTIGAVCVGHASGVVTGTNYAVFAYAGGSIGSISQSGTTAVLYNTTSDQRLKTNIVDAPDASALIDSIKVRSFDWISDESHQRYGMVAQELALVAPEAVHAPADPDEMMAVDYSKLVPMLIKEIQSLRARVAALEA
jgi:hypothetical protein